MTDHEPRLSELAVSLRRVQERIAAACTDSQRDPSQVKLVVVTKFFPASDVLHLAQLGVDEVGENRDQEAGPKAAQVRAALPKGPRWHFIGQLQTNKAASVASYADVVQSVDRVRLVNALEKGAAKAGRELEVLLQVDLGQGADQGRGGALPQEIPQLGAAVADCEYLKLAGLMAVAPLGAPARPAFERLAALAHTLQAEHPDARVISAGMSGDLEDAIACGATHLRVGTAILGARPPLR
ncbi:YggS family pyridoxal phosphate-dependent enzyme [Gephyromycinifex aptenodytis]|uniref:YggS family pyridoxal phosphate-dependent enzyme n=1 Tax=Gephyromycinifex aptenodytis TaxID=2716227 RepID=UPI001446AE1F|nr:YggS family pyridoxal phosphate-dependent enzyme [Gephyromycinifex aptenodytis]